MCCEPDRFDRPSVLDSMGIPPPCPLPSSAPVPSPAAASAAAAAAARGDVIWPAPSPAGHRISVDAIGAAPAPAAPPPPPQPCSPPTSSCPPGLLLPPVLAPSPSPGTCSDSCLRNSTNGGCDGDAAAVGLTAADDPDPPTLPAPAAAAAATAAAADSRIDVPVGDAAADSCPVLLVPLPLTLLPPRDAAAAASPPLPLTRPFWLARRRPLLPVCASPPPAPADGVPAIPEVDGRECGLRPEEEEAWPEEEDERPRGPPAPEELSAMGGGGTVMPLRASSSRMSWRPFWW